MRGAPITLSRVPQWPRLRRVPDPASGVLLGASPPWGFSHSKRYLLALSGRGGVGQVAQPVRLALTGSLASPPLFEMIEALGRETTRRRILAFADRIAAPAPAN